jgi:hypothetical protein
VAAGSAAPGAGGPQRPSSAMNRTLVGLPAANAPLPGSMRGVARPAAVPAAPAAPPAAPAAAAPSPVAAPAARPSPPASVSPALAAAVGGAVDQKMATLAARGPEYEAIAKLSREIIEQVVWEVVPELAEAIIREQMEKRGRA